MKLYVEKYQEMYCLWETDTISHNKELWLISRSFTNMDI